MIARRAVWPVLLAAVLALVHADPAQAQTLSLDFGDDASLATRTVRLFLLIGLLSVAPGLAIMVTCFPFMITVLAILRQAIGVQQSPPNMLIVSLALFLTWFVMEPVFATAWTEGLKPMSEGILTPEQAGPLVIRPFQEFMETRADPDIIASLQAVRSGDKAVDASAPVTLAVLVPAFMLSEITRGFEAGFLIFLPFLIIDLVVAAILMSMGMMMIPPAAVSLPFKLIFFVMADGWALLAGSMVRSYATV